jgi:hypothetical protein
MRCENQNSRFFFLHVHFKTKYTRKSIKNKNEELG